MKFIVRIFVMGFRYIEEIEAADIERAKSDARSLIAFKYPKCDQFSVKPA